MPCWVPECNTGAALSQVNEVLFDDGTEAGVRLRTSDYMVSGTAPKICLAHRFEYSARLASIILEQAFEIGNIKGDWPARWWVLYEDGHITGGPVVPRPGEKPPARKEVTPQRALPRRNVDVWCLKHWQQTVLPGVKADNVNAIALTLDLFQAILDDPACAAFVAHYPVGHHERAVADFLQENGPACCYLGEARLQELMAGKPKGGS